MNGIRTRRSGARRTGLTDTPPGALAETATDDRVPGPAWIFAAAFVALELAVSDRYGFQQDELYFLVAGHHLAFGYVDQPPLAPLLTRITGVLGVSPTAIRIIPALAGGAIVVIAARLAALFGAGRAGRILAALATACAPVLLGAMHVGNTTPYDLLAWAVVLACVATALLRERPRWWLGAGATAGIGLENEYLLGTLVAALVIGIIVTEHRGVLRQRWPWIGGGIALVIWAPNLAWQATHGWPQLTMAAALHQQNTSAADYIGGLPAQLVYAGLLGIPLVIAGFIRLWRTPEQRFIAVAGTLIVIYVLAWVPGKVYYTDGVLPAVLAAGSVSAERWIAAARRPRVRWWILGVAAAVSTVLVALNALPVLPLARVHTVTSNHSLSDSIGWPQLTAEVAAQDAVLTRAGRPPTSIFTGAYAEAGALDVYGGPYHLPPVLSGHNTFWMWGPGNASDTTVLVVDALGQLQPYFASCRLLVTFNPPYQVQSDWNDLQIGVCTGPSASWPVLWPHLRHYD
ncbi:glycosyltransferase family 39 protein [Trebonia sp.]|uniref:glycosyltransferase family 39 protein n=1 Tax=Trebonia sp. TaxID=2767075 RepID=UPI00261EA577|nr:glycosyltransferase family 39 protein [Trebonia sp.]